MRQTDDLAKRELKPVQQLSFETEPECDTVLRSPVSALQFSGVVWLTGAARQLSDCEFPGARCGDISSFSARPMFAIWNYLNSSREYARNAAANSPNRTIFQPSQRHSAISASTVANSARRGPVQFCKRRGVIFSSSRDLRLQRPFPWRCWQTSDNPSPQENPVFREENSEISLSFRLHAKIEHLK